MGKRSCAAAAKPAAHRTAGYPRQPCNRGMLRMFHKSRKFSNSWSCHRIATVLSCHSETSAHTGRGNPFPKAPSDEGASPEGRWGREKTISLPPSPAVTPPSSEGGIGSADCHGLRTVQRPVPTAPRNDSGGTRKAPLPKGGSARRAVGDSLYRSCIPRRERIYPFRPPAAVILSKPRSGTPIWLPSQGSCHRR